MTQIAPAPSPLAAPTDAPLDDVASTIAGFVGPLTITRPVPYHRVARALPNHRWWRPLAVLGISLFVYVGIMVLTFIPLVIAGLADARVMEWMDRTLPDGATDLHDPVTFIASFGMIALMYPAVAVGVRVGGGRRPGTLASVAGRLRWRLLSRSAVVALAVMVVVQSAALSWSALVGGQSVRLTWDARSSVHLLVAAIVLVPFQAAAEEYAFRGVLQQTIGSWLRSPWWGILVPIPLFVAGHAYDWRGLVDVAAFALAAGVLTWRTGGLEAAIGLHVVNNVLVTVLGALGMADLNATVVPTSAMVFSLTGTAMFTVVILRYVSPARRLTQA